MLPSNIHSVDKIAAGSGLVDIILPHIRERYRPEPSPPAPTATQPQQITCKNLTETGNYTNCSIRGIIV